MVYHKGCNLETDCSFFYAEAAKNCKTEPLSFLKILTMAAK